MKQGRTMLPARMVCVCVLLCVTSDELSICYDNFFPFPAAAVCCALLFTVTASEALVKWEEVIDDTDSREDRAKHKNTSPGG